MGLKELRTTAGMSLQELSKKSGVHYVKIAQIETGKINPENITLKNAIRLSDALGCSVKELL